MLEREVPESELIDWIAVEQPVAKSGQPDDVLKGRVRLRILIGSPEQHQSDAEILPLPFSHRTFETLRRAWDLPKELLRMMLSTLPISTGFRAVGASGESVRGLMIRSARSRDWNFCLGLAHNEKTGITCVVINGMQAHEVELLIKCLQESSRYLCDPMLLPLFLLELKVHYFAVLLETRARRIEEIELATGMRHGFSANARRKDSRQIEREQILKEVNFDEITQKLTSSTGTLSFCDMTFATSLGALDLTCTIRDRLFTLRDKDRRGIDATETDVVETRIAYLRELIVGAQAHSGVLSARTRAQVQTVGITHSRKLPTASHIAG